MPIRDSLRERMFGPSLDDLTISLQMYNKEIAMTRDRYKQRAEATYDQAKEYLVKGDDNRAKMYAQQHLSCDRAAFSLDMFVIKMDGLVFDLKNAENVELIGLTLGKVSKCLDKLNILKTKNVSKIMAKVNQQMGRIGLGTSRIMDQLQSYDPFSVEPVSSKDLDKLMGKMVDEVIAEGPATGLPEAKLSELQGKREALKGRSSGETK